MINIFDEFDSKVLDLFCSMKAVGLKATTVVLQDNGWLPDEVVTPWSFFLKVSHKGTPLYFNEVKVPNLWEIRASNRNGEIYDYERKAAEITFANPKDKRLVQEVKWYDDKNRTRSIDHYNKYGWKFAETVYNVEGKEITRFYFDESGRQVIMHNYLTKDIILNEGSKVKIFQGIGDFVSYFLKRSKLNLDKVNYNSLSVPFFITVKLPNDGEDTLFWQEKSGNQIPGNMKYILEGNAPRTKKIVFFDKEEYKKAKSVNVNSANIKLRLSGYIYNAKKYNKNRKEALILTNSDQLEKFDELISGLPEMNFSVVAVTEMSEKLEKYENRDNVQLYPNVSRKKIRELYKECDYYFDINHQDELKNAVRNAYERGMLIYSFKNTAHSNSFISDSNIYAPEAFINLIKDVKKCLRDDKLLQRKLSYQMDAADETSIDEFLNCINS